MNVEDVSHWFASPEGGQLQVLDRITLSIGTGEFVGVVGPSGCGKTTLMNVVAGLEVPTRGRVSVLDGSPRAGNQNVGYLLARDALLPWRSVAANAQLAMEIRGVAKAERQARAAEMLARLGMDRFAEAYPAQLSQGMRQRVAIARTISTTPKLLLLDEPFAALDAQTKLLLQDMFSSLWQTIDSTVILITHDLHEAIALADRVVVMTARPGRIKSVFTVDLPRPRSIVALQGDDCFHRIYERIWAELREEVVTTQ